ncbi:signal peptidase I [Halorientalis halophila]|uniref:signal peptidase I n=1 Tax=Halorientalis halophila TaxID=3108499 RepID=UPI00300AA3CF
MPEAPEQRDELEPREDVESQDETVSVDRARARFADWSPAETVSAWTARDVLRVLAVVVFVALVAPFVVFAIPQLAGAQHSFVVLSGSMEPTIETGSVILVAETAPESIESGDVITFGGSASAPPTTHRVIEVQETGDGREFVTKGDNNENADRGTVQAADLVGRVPSVDVPGVGPILFSIPLVGHFITFGGTKLGMLLLVIVPFGLLAVDSAIRTVRSADAGRADGGSPADPHTDRAVDDWGEGPPSDGDGAPPDPSGPSNASASSDDGGLTVSSLTLLVAAVGLGAAGLLAGWVGLRNESVAATTVGTGLFTAGLLAGLVLYADRRLDDGEDRGATRAPAPIAVGRVPDRLRTWPVLEVDSAASLRESSAADGSVVVRDPDADRLFLFRDGVAYTPCTDGTGDRETVVDYLPDHLTDDGSPDGDDADGTAEPDWNEITGPREGGEVAASKPPETHDHARNGNGGTDDE